jgi:hypothetical protein
MMRKRRFCHARLLLIQGCLDVCDINIYSLLVVFLASKLCMHSPEKIGLVGRGDGHFLARTYKFDCKRAAAIFLRVNPYPEI